MSEERIVYLSRLVLDPRRKEVREALRDRYKLHQLVYSFRGDAAQRGTEDGGRLLWRLEPVKGGEPPVILMLSPGELSRESYERRGEDWPVQQARTSGLLLRIPAGVYAFRIEANPIRRRERSRAVPLREPMEQVAWLQERIAPLELLEVVPVRTEVYKIRKPGTQPYPLHAVLFEGRLRVPEGEEEAAKRLFLEGVGRGKAMGLGMLSLR